ncbi:hypothetical protein GCM10027290_52330 [Micromonospora sonneratiae]|uniref:Tetratricopeptide repeat protein n=1 Tax=Micromonospora sonneratiae TaxID=1184706 RepID=A0ABW3YB02_9ACTN
MSSGVTNFALITAQANDLVASGDLAGAQELLSDALSSADPRPSNASAELTEAAILQARVLVTLGEPHSARGWAAFAYAATTRLYGPTDQRTIATAATLAAVLHRIGSHERAARLYQDVVIELTATDGPESLRVLAAHADLATVEYAQGECNVARERLADAWELHREVYGDGHLGGIKMLARLGAMQRDCGHFTEAHEHLALARELCRTHLPPDHPLAIQVAALARAAANPDHVCAGTPPSSPGPAPGASAAGNPHPTGRAGNDPAGPGVPFDPNRLDGAGQWWPSGDTQPPTHGAPQHPGPQHQPDHWTQSMSTVPAPHSGPAMPPAVPSLVSGGAGGASSPLAIGGGDADGTHHARNLPERWRPPLPATIQPPPQKAVRRLLPIILGGALVVVLGAAAVIAGFALVDKTPAKPSGVTRTGPDGAPLPAAPPSNVTLRDNQSSILLTWAYPPGAQGSVVVSGGRVGQEITAFDELAAGTTSYIVSNLTPDHNYCFTIAVFYSTDLVARSEPVCTKRAGVASGN